MLADAKAESFDDSVQVYLESPCQIITFITPHIRSYLFS
jgi:hypothetical protein